MIKEVIILAGGLGTRLRSVVSDVPKCMAPIAGQPFLGIMINHLLSRGIETFTISVGYKGEVIIAYLKTNFPSVQFNFVIEETPLGTGGAIKLSCKEIKSPKVLVLNGDTFFDVDLFNLSEYSSKVKADCILCLKPMENFDRYGVVEISNNFRITSFKEKKYYNQGLINGGVYLLNSKLLESLSLPEKFSFEKDFLEQYYHSKDFYGFVDQGYFIDIGIPEDYTRAQHELLKYIK